MNECKTCVSCEKNVTQRDKSRCSQKYEYMFPSNHAMKECEYENKYQCKYLSERSCRIRKQLDQKQGDKYYPYRSHCYSYQILIPFPIIFAFVEFDKIRFLVKNDEKERTFGKKDGFYTEMLKEKRYFIMIIRVILKKR